jgi:8-oxo-dGTP diphosphatase
VSYVYKQPRPGLTVDCVVLGWDPEGLKARLVERRTPPFRGFWALPGGFVRLHETLELAAERELREATGLEHAYLEQFHTFDAVERDPRERVVSVAFLALVRSAENRSTTTAGDRTAQWFRVNKLPQMAFDHRAMIRRALSELRNRSRFEPIGFELLPQRFTLTHLQRLFEAIFERPLDKRNFRRKLLDTKLLTPLEDQQTGVAHRRARLYRFDKRRYKQLGKDGVFFAI